MPAAGVDRLRALSRDGADTVIERERRELPRDLEALLRLAPVTLDELLELHRRFGVSNAADLAAALPHLTRPGGDPGAELGARLRVALPSLRADRSRIPLGRAFTVLEAFVTAIVNHAGGRADVEPVGSFRRLDDSVGDLSVLAVAPDPRTVLPIIAEACPDAEFLQRSDWAASVRFRNHEIHVRIELPEYASCALVHYTGSPGHVRALGELAASRGLSLTSRTLVDRASNRVIGCPTEASVYEALGIPFIEPEIRHGEDEVADARAGRLPNLVREDDIRGDLHAHTLWSDGQDTVEAVVRAARHLGYEYIAITDHSPHAATSRTLDEARLLEQRAEVDRLRRRFPDIAILQGIEVDIRPDGGLDLPDHALEPLDIVLASLHDPAGQNRDQLTARYLKAIRHPLVDVITHPTSRLVGRRDGLDIDVEAVFAAAVESATALEIDGAPAHLDMDGHLARKAIDAGALVAIDSDAHRASSLGLQMRLGIGTARRGRVTADRVLNAKPLGALRTWLAARRQRSRSLARA